MPTVPRNPKCAQLACPNAKARYSVFCLDHGGTDVKTYKPSTQARRDFNDKYSSAFWRTTRITQLSAHPLCAGCLATGRIEQAQAVDHVFPWRQIGEHAFQHNLFQSLCQPCHASKTTLEQRGLFRRYGTPNRDYRPEDYARILGTD